MKKQKPEYITDVLRRAIARKKYTIAEISRQTGVQYMSLLRFARGDQSIVLNSADRVAAFLGVKVTQEDEEDRKT
ncbi:MAG: helix-turn-helix transcriptional regulator [Candidatus Hydrogenedentes bacterium]|nr:helix-turn-helix transcriptional regulator [Candidatus Hydrogenedentota bacterium]